MTEENKETKNEYDYSIVLKDIEEYAKKENISPERIWWFMKFGIETTSSIAALLFRIK